MLADNKNIARNLRDDFPNPYTKADAERYIAEALGSEREISRAVEFGGELAGCVSLILDDELILKSAEIGCWIGEKYWRRGIATAAAAAMCGFGFENLGLDRIYAGVFENNLAAAKVLVKIGFKFEGRLEGAVCKGGELLDAFLYGIDSHEKLSTNNNCGNAERQR